MFYNRNNKLKSPFYHKNKRDGDVFQFEYSYSNENLVKGETFEREVLDRFKNLIIFSICFLCISYLLNEDKLLFSNGDYQSWAVRVEDMRNDKGPGFENTMDKDYDYVEDPRKGPNFNEPFQVARIGRYKLVSDGGCDMFVFLSFDKNEEGFLIPVQCKYGLNENMQLYDLSAKYKVGTKTLNNYLSDFDSLLDQTRYSDYVMEKARKGEIRPSKERICVKMRLPITNKYAQQIIG